MIDFILGSLALVWLYVVKMKLIFPPITNFIPN